MHALSQVHQHHDFPWTDTAWRGRALPGAVIYELHIGTFTPEGTFEAAARRLDHLVELGIDLVEVMPVTPFPGVHGWGYDGVAPFAVHEPYGGPDAFKLFVDACHARGLGVVLDVVYNHLGPAGNYLGALRAVLHRPAPHAVGLGGEPRRRRVRRGAALHHRQRAAAGCATTTSTACGSTPCRPSTTTARCTCSTELSAEVDALAAALGRPLFVIAETDLNDPRTITAREAGGQGMHGQWDDDVHHALHALLTGERQGYYDDFGSLANVSRRR